MKRSIIAVLVMSLSTNVSAMETKENGSIILSKDEFAVLTTMIRDMKSDLQTQKKAIENLKDKMIAGKDKSCI